MVVLVLYLMEHVLVIVFIQLLIKDVVLFIASSFFSFILRVRPTAGRVPSTQMIYSD